MFAIAKFLLNWQLSRTVWARLSGLLAYLRR